MPAVGQVAGQLAETREGRWNDRRDFNEAHGE
jgi:hypothetical protein